MGKINHFEKPTSGIVVDASTTGGNPGWSEYKGVDLATGEILFQGTIGLSTNNVGEFVALSHGIHRALADGYEYVYSDSMTALCWAMNSKCNTDMNKKPKYAKAFDYVSRCEKMLKTLSITGKYTGLFKVEGMLTVKKWDTRNWGENPADFGRK